MGRTLGMGSDSKPVTGKTDIMSGYPMEVPQDRSDCCKTHIENENPMLDDENPMVDDENPMVDARKWREVRRGT